MLLASWAASHRAELGFAESQDRADAESPRSLVELTGFEAFASVVMHSVRMCSERDPLSVAAKRGTCTTSRSNCPIHDPAVSRSTGGPQDSGVEAPHFV